MAEYYDPKTYPKKWNYLQSGTIIDQYMVERELVHGGFSSVYLARQLNDQTQVAIKEYLPRKLAHRTWNNVIVPNSEDMKVAFLRGQALFFGEAKILTKLKHPNIIDVINFFKANQTAYIVMPYYYGITLDKIQKRKLLPITEPFLQAVFDKILNALEMIHRHGLVHLDIKPGNILICPGNNPLLLDFGAIQPYPVHKNRMKIKVLTKGFSPIEQHTHQGRIGPWTDIYAIGASIRYCLEGKVPVSSPERQENDPLIPASKAFKRKYSAFLLEAVDWAMQIDQNKRPQSIAEFKQALAGNKS